MIFFGPRGCVIFFGPHRFCAFLFGPGGCMIFAREVAGLFFGGCVIFYLPKRLRDFFCLKGCMIFLPGMRGCMIFLPGRLRDFFWSKRLRDFFWAPQVL